MDYFEYLIQQQQFFLKQEPFYCFLVVVMAAIIIGFMYFWYMGDKTYKPVELRIKGSKDEVNKLLEMLKHGED